MTSIEAAALYVGINLIILLALAWQVIGARRSEKVGFGDGGNEILARRIRVHANAAEWVPGMLVGLIALGLVDAHLILIHVLGAALTVARVLHAVGLSGSAGTSFGRFAGALITLIVYAVGGIALIWYAVT